MTHGTTRVHAQDAPTRGTVTWVPSRDTATGHSHRPPITGYRHKVLPLDTITGYIHRVQSLEALPRISAEEQHHSGI